MRRSLRLAMAVAAFAFAATPLPVRAVQDAPTRLAAVRAAPVPAARVAADLASVMDSAVDQTRSVDVLPPGNSGYMSALSFATAQLSGNCADQNPHACDSTYPYRDFQYKDDSLYNLTHPGQNDVASSPAPGVVVIRTPDGVPHVFGYATPATAAEENVAFGAGVVHAEDRLFQMELFRRAGEGRLSELLGPGYLAYDEQWRRETETVAELDTGFALAPQPIRIAVQHYVDGVNEVIDQVNANPAMMPAEFTALQDVPVARWTVEDTLGIAVLQIKSFGEDGGNELDHALLGQKLLERYGPDLGIRIFDDVFFRNDPGSPTTVPPDADQAGPTSSSRLAYDYTSFKRADTLRLLQSLPVHLADHLDAQAARTNAISTVIRRLGLPHLGSNAMLISPSRSSTGHAILYGGPQVGYNIPDLFHEIELRGGRIAARGVGFAGAGPAVLIGHGKTFAYTTTSGQDDEVDTYVERIRRVPGRSSAPDYEFFRDGSWLPVKHLTANITYRISTPNLPVVGSQTPPLYRSETVDVYRTWHRIGTAQVDSPIFAFDTADGLAFSKLRAFFNRETGVANAYFNYQAVRSVDEFRSLALGITAALNQYYADTSGHILYMHAGSIPLRVPGHDPRLPVPGDGSYDWRGLLPPDQWPYALDPPRGWMANWNSRPAANWIDSGDGTRWGRFHRVAILDQELAARLSRPDAKVGVADVERIAQVAATRELRAATLFKPYVTGIGSWAARHGIPLSPAEQEAVARIAAWDGAAFYPDGAVLDSKVVARYRDPAATIWLSWIEHFQDALYRPWFAPVMHGYTLAAFRDAIDSPDQGPREFEDNYDPLMLRILQGPGATLPPLVDYLAPPGGAYAATATDYPDSVLAGSHQALVAAISELQSKLGGDQSTWHAPTPVIHFAPLGAGFAPDIPFENRGTFVQVVELTGPSSTAVAGGSAAAVSGVPNTGGAGGGGPAAAVVAILSAGLVARSRRAGRRHAAR